MVTTHLSPFAEPFPVMSPVEGVRLATLHSGMRYKNRDDVLLVSLPEGTSCAGVFTTNRMPGAPIPWSRKVAESGAARALIVNAGIANVFTGKKGVAAVELTARAVAEALAIPPQQVVVASTGVIGEPVHTDKLVPLAPKLAAALSPTAWEQAARAIMTTDTFPKGVSRSATIGDTVVTLNGFIKGSGMIEPNMATLLGYIFTDATVPPHILDHWLKEALPFSYNAITVDGDTSTSDMIVCFATNRKKHWPISDPNDPAWTDFREKFFDLHREMAKLVIKDGEGIGKFITVRVSGAASDKAAQKIAKSIANSPLVKTALAASDANWGRIAAAAGKAGEKCNPEKSCIWAGQYLIALDGAPYIDAEWNEINAYMKEPYLDIAIDVGVGKGEATVYTCDLTHEYIRINAEYRS